ncbi:Receptor-interacting serine/threonine-protein kinase 4 [Collichthys lucidus]|uniref:Receptor-interacting serine/threonine-protein kinase 4 n=1 Tax=Collichthys lucidus TaxID=240159 RepID=A0A4V6ANL9_COLLU|nr:Receptor-interacting serine/threonine-protein kinase 4 [Collichthys lucidus]
MDRPIKHQDEGTETEQREALADFDEHLPGFYTNRPKYNHRQHLVSTKEQEMALWSHKEVYDKDLDILEKIGSGGFGEVYKARHKEWKFVVALKILKDSCPIITKENDLFREANHMEVVSCKYVVKVLGIYQGRPQVGVKQTPMEKGIVMEFMERGSLQSLLNKPLIGPLPWPLPLRLAYEVALGMNFLHSKDLLHKDLKPSNVLLDENLNAKLADFGLCRVSTSVLKSNREETGVSGGSYKYMPPEAFTTSYKPVRAFDRYSYGILLWTLITGKEPYGTEESMSVDIVDGGHLTNTEAPLKQENPQMNFCQQDSVKVPTKRMSDANKAKFVDDQRTDLIQTVSAVMPIVEELGNMVHSEIYSEIESKSTSQDKMRKIYNTVLRSGGEKVKAAFYDALQKHHFL